MVNKIGKELFSWIKAIAVAVLITFVVRYFLYTPVLVQGPSMMPTLQSGDRMIVNKWSNDFDRFDVVVFHSPDGRDFIKRVIGLPGETVDYQGDQLYINGELVQEPFLNTVKQRLDGSQWTEDFTLFAQTGERVVPEGTLFVMGDNRGNSIDSRAFGPINMEEVVGKTNVIFWPISDVKFVE